MLGDTGNKWAVCILLVLFYALFTLDVCICVSITIKITLMKRMGSDPFCVFVFAVTIDAMSNFDSDVDTNAWKVPEDIVQTNVYASSYACKQYK